MRPNKPLQPIAAKTRRRLRWSWALKQGEKNESTQPVDSAHDLLHPSVGRSRGDHTASSAVGRDVGASGLWVHANICFAGMRAQNSPSTGWRIVAFIFGFPGTLITYFVVDEGSERAYGIEIP
jgi:hypothetical protein